MEQQNEIIIYQSQDGTIKWCTILDRRFTTQTQIALFERLTHYKWAYQKNIRGRRAEWEYRLFEIPQPLSMVRLKIRHRATRLPHYNLDVIISVGYRVKSMQGTQFRIWATQRLRDYIIKGFTLNDERFKSGSSMNYFRESTVRQIREIRLFERLFYQQIKRYLRH